MSLIKQNAKLPIINLDCIDDRKCSIDGKHGSLLPPSLRGILCGPSGCGKTNAMLTLLFDKNGLKFKNVFVYSKSLYQPKYVLLGEILNDIKEVNYMPFKENIEIMKPEDAAKDSIFIFDDIACDSQNSVREFFSMGRHKSIDCFYLCQTYSRIPKQLIRDNSNFIVIFQQDDTNLKHIYSDHVNGDMTFEQFKRMCAKCWNGDYRFGFLTIVKDCDLKNGRYREKFDQFIHPN